MPFVQAHGARLYWKAEGDPGKAPLVLLNSIGAALGSWDRALPYLTDQFHVIRMDMRGHGASDAPAEDYNLAGLAHDALAVMDAAGVMDAVICGVSLGGMVAMTLALCAPSRARALVLACTSARMDAAAWTDRIAKVRAGGMQAISAGAMERFLAPDFLRQHPDIAGSLRSELETMSAAGYAGCGAALRDGDLGPSLSQLALPVLVLCGTKDISTPFETHGRVIVESAADVRRVDLHTAHLAQVEDPLQFSAEVTTFVQSLAPPLPQGAETAADYLYGLGLTHRRAVLGEVWVDRALAARTDFNSDFQAMITRIAWQEIWGRPGLDRRTRRLLVLAITAALGRWEEFRLHTRAGLTQGGFTSGELKETLMQTAIYAGVPAANTAFSEAAEIMAQIDAGGA